MKKIFTPYLIKLLYLLVFIMAVPAFKSPAQKKAVAFLNHPVVYINLMLPSADSLLLVDGTGALYSNEYSANVDGYDAGKLSNFNENICLLRDGQKLAIEARPLPKNADTLFVRMWGMVQPSYDLQINIKSIPLLLPVHAWLVDNYLHTQTPINLFSKTLYSFSLSTADTNSYINRFMVVLVHHPWRENTVTTSNAVQLNTGNVTVYPNPFSGNKLTLHFNNMAKDSYRVELRGLSGEVLESENIVHAEGSNEYYLPVNSVYTKGIYTVTITGKSSKKIIHLPVIIN